MAEILTPDLCVLGAGAGGVAAAILAAAAGASVVLVEKRLLDDGHADFALIAHVVIDAARRVAARQSDPLLGLYPFHSTIDLTALRVRAERLAKRRAMASSDHGRSREK